MTRTQGAFFALCALLVGTNVALVLQNQDLKKRVEAAESRSQRYLEAKAGTKVQSLKGFDLSGKRVEYAYGTVEQPTLILSYSPTCSFCDENWPAWEFLLELFPEEVMRTVAVDISGQSGATYFSERGIQDGISVITEIDAGNLMDYHFRLTPQTILVRPEGVIEKVWTGLLSDQDLQDIGHLVYSINSDQLTQIPTPQADSRDRNS